MLIDTHGHINMMVKKKFDCPLDEEQFKNALSIVGESADAGVNIIINVGTSLIESKNCIALAKQSPNVYATVGIHPNDCTPAWQKNLEELKVLVKDKRTNKIVGIGECGLDKHYPNFNLPRQIDAFQAQIELALEHDLALVVHTRDASQETLRVIEPYRNDIERGIIHCFSEGMDFAIQVIEWGFILGIGGTITYPKNDILREVVKSISLDDFILETDAPFLPIQAMRGKKNHPKYIKEIAEFIAATRMEPFKTIAEHTTTNAKRVFNI